jgi:succinoglycan biosynthesis protein ExoO
MKPAEPAAKPRTSVVLPIYNSAATITRALRSLVRQSDQNFEVLIIDDGSSDDGLEQARKLYGDDPRYRLIGPRSNTGPSAARNVAVSLAEGEWIALLDADDAWLPDRLSNLHQHTDHADFVADDLQLFDVMADVVVGTMFSGFSVRELTLSTHLADWFVKGADTGYLKPIMRKAFLERISLKYDVDLRHGEDYLLYTLALVNKARFRLIPSAGYIYTMPSGPRSGQKSPFSRTVTNGPLLADKLRSCGASGAKS